MEKIPRIIFSLGLIIILLSLAYIPIPSKTTGNFFMGEIYDYMPERSSKLDTQSILTIFVIGAVLMVSGMTLDDRLKSLKYRKKVLPTGEVADVAELPNVHVVYMDKLDEKDIRHGRYIPNIPETKRGFEAYGLSHDRSIIELKKDYTDKADRGGVKREEINGSIKRIAELESRLSDSQLGYSEKKKIYNRIKYITEHIEKQRNYLESLKYAVHMMTASHELQHDITRRDWEKDFKDFSNREEFDKYDEAASITTELRTLLRYVQRGRIGIDVARERLHGILEGHFVTDNKYHRQSMQLAVGVKVLDEKMGLEEMKETSNLASKLWNLKKNDLGSLMDDLYSIYKGLKNRYREEKKNNE
jgi:hypothetical protein